MGIQKLGEKNIGLTRYLNLIKGWGDVSGLPPPAIYHENIKVGVELIIIILKQGIDRRKNCDLKKNTFPMLRWPLLNI